MAEVDTNWAETSFIGELPVVEGRDFDGLAVTAAPAAAPLAAVVRGELTITTVASPLPSSSPSPSFDSVCRRDLVFGGRVAPEKLSSCEGFVCSDDTTLLLRRAPWRGELEICASGVLSVK